MLVPAGRVIIILLTSIGSLFLLTVSPTPSYVQEIK